jgi:hypothetical protein
MTTFKKKKIPSDTLEHDLQVWEKTVDVQMHFNELQMKIRNFGILLVSAIVGVAGIALKEHTSIGLKMFGYYWSGNLTSVLFLVAAACWLCFYFMDLFWYHPLLIGAVRHGATIEKALMKRMPSITLGDTISKESAMKIGEVELHSDDKSSIFYLAIFTLLILSSVAAAWVTTDNGADKGPPPGAATTVMNITGPTETLVAPATKAATDNGQTRTKQSDPTK